MERNNASEESIVEMASEPTDPEGSHAPPERSDPVARIAARFVRGEHGHASLPTRGSAALRRMDPERPSRALFALIPALDGSGARFNDDEDLRRWATVVHCIAVLSGTGGARAHSGASRYATGRRIHEASYSEHRLSRLLSARGPALTDQVRRLARFLAAARAVPIDLEPLAQLLLHEGRDETRAERARLLIARAYYGAVDRQRRAEAVEASGSTVA